MLSQHLQVMIYQFRPRDGRPVAGDDGVNVQVQSLELHKRTLVFVDIGKCQIAKMFLEDGAGIEHLFPGKINEDVVWRVRRPQIQGLYVSLLKLEVSRIGDRGQHQRNTG